MMRTKLVRVVIVTSFSAFLVFSWMPITGTQAATLSQVYTGTATISVNTSSTTANIGATVDTAKSFLVFGATGNTGSVSGGDVQVRGKFNSSSQLLFDRGDTGGTITIQWYVVNFSSGIFAQSGDVSLATTDSDTNVTLSTAIDPTRSFVLVSTKTDSAVNTGEATAMLKGTLTGCTTTCTTITLHRDLTGANATVTWTVVTWDSDATVQYGTTTIAAGSASQTQTITSVDTTKTFLVFNYSVADSAGRPDYNRIRGALTGATGLLFQRETATSAPQTNIAWYVVSLSQGLTGVQRDTTSLPAILTKDVTIASVTTSNSFVLLSSENTSTGDRYDYRALVKGTLTSSTNLHIERDGDTSTTTTVSYQVVELNPSAPTAVILSSFTASGDNSSRVLMLMWAGIGTAISALILGARIWLLHRTRSKQNG